MQFLNFQKQRKKPVEKPDFTFIEIFWRWAPNADGTSKKLSLRERWNRGVQLADWWAHKARKGIEALVDKLRGDEEYDPMNMGKGGGGGEFKPADAEEVLRDRETHRARAEEAEARVERMGPDSRGVPGREGMRVQFTPDRPENRIESDYVGPERQMRRNDDPWPLPAPEGRNDATGASPEQDKGPGQVTGPAPLKALPAPETARSQDAAQETTGDSGRGAAAAEKGRAAAQVKAERKAQSRKSRVARSESAPEL